MLGNCIHENQRPKKVSLSSPDVVEYTYDEVIFVGQK